METVAVFIGVFFSGLLLRVCQQAWRDARQDAAPGTPAASLLWDTLPCRDLPCYTRPPTTPPAAPAALSPPVAEEGEGVATAADLASLEDQTDQTALQECCICLEPMMHTRHTPLAMMPCGHLYHRRCIEDWHRTKTVVPCPECGYDLSTYSEQVAE